MKQKYPDGDVIAPGTVIISAGANCIDINKVVEPVLKKNGGNIYYINLSQDDFKLGGSSFAQILNKIGNDAPTIKDATSFKSAFNVIQDLINSDEIQAGHDIGSGGLITTLLEMCFADNDLGANINLSTLGEIDALKVLFAENIGVVFQADESIEATLNANKVTFHKIASVSNTATLNIANGNQNYSFDINHL